MRSKVPSSAGFYRLVRTAGLAAMLGGLAPARTVLAQASPELSIALRGRVRSSEGQRSEHLALVELELIPPGGAGQAVATLVDLDTELENAAGTAVPLDPLERDEAAVPLDAPNVRGRGRGGQTKQQQLLRSIPFVVSPGFAREVIEAALRSHGVTPALTRLDGLSSRAKNSAILPEVRLRAGRDADHSLRLSPTTDDPYRYSQSGGISFVVEGAVTWRLGKLVFAGEELSIERLRLAQARERQRVSQLTLQELFDWQAAWRRHQALGGEQSTAVEDLHEATLRLDMLTDGWFSAHQPEQTAPSHPREDRELGDPAIPPRRGSVAPPPKKTATPERAPREADPGSIPDVRLDPAASRLRPTNMASRERSASSVQPAARRKVVSREPPHLEGFALSR